MSFHGIEKQPINNGICSAPHAHQNVSPPGDSRFFCQQPLLKKPFLESLPSGKLLHSYGPMENHRFPWVNINDFNGNFQVRKQKEFTRGEVIVNHPIKSHSYPLRSPLNYHSILIKSH